MYAWLAGSGPTESWFLAATGDLSLDPFICSVGRARPYLNVGRMFPGFRFSLFSDYVFCTSMRVCHFLRRCCLLSFFLLKGSDTFFFKKKALSPASKEMIPVIR